MSPTAGSRVGGPAPLMLLGLFPPASASQDVPLRAWTDHKCLQDGPGPGLDTRPSPRGAPGHPTPRALPRPAHRMFQMRPCWVPGFWTTWGVFSHPGFLGPTGTCGFQSCVLRSSQKPGASCQPRGVGGALVVSGVSAAGTRDPLTGAHVGDTDRKEPTWPPARGEGAGPCPSPSSRRCSRRVSLEDGSREVTECSGASPAALGESLGSVCSSPHRVY